MNEFDNGSPLSPDDARERNIRRAVGGVAVLLLAGLVALVVVHGSNGDNPKVAASSDSSSSSSLSSVTSTSSKSSTTVVVPAAVSACGAPATSPAVFDPKGGRYAVLLNSMDTSAKTITFDVIQFLTGDEANKAYKKDNPSSTDGAPDDYYIVNSSRQLYTLKYVDNAPFAITTDGADTHVLTPEALKALLVSGEKAGPPFWARVNNNYVQGICEQFVP